MAFPLPEGVFTSYMKQALLVAPLVPISADGAIRPDVPNRYVITKPSAAALTLTAPSNDNDGLYIMFISATNAAHQILTPIPGLFYDGGLQHEILAFGGSDIGDSVKIMAYQGKWIVLNKSNVTIAGGE